MCDSWERVGESGRWVGKVDSLRLKISMWITDVRNKHRRANIPPKKPEVVLPGPQQPAFQEWDSHSAARDG